MSSCNQSCRQFNNHSATNQAINQSILILIMGFPLFYTCVLLIPSYNPLLIQFSFEIYLERKRRHWKTLSISKRAFLLRRLYFVNTIIAIWKEIQLILNNDFCKTFYQWQYNGTKLPKVIIKVHMIIFLLNSKVTPFV